MALDRRGGCGRGAGIAVMMTGVSLVLLAFVAAVATGAYLEPGSGDGAVAPRPDPMLRPPMPPGRIPSAQQALRAFLDGTQFLPATGEERLTVYPVRTRAREGSRYLDLDRGIRSGRVLVTEARGGGEVDTVYVRNRSPETLLLLSGEIVMGGKQDRVIREDLLIPPGARPIPIPVSCVEKDRWSGSGDSFGEAVYSALPATRGSLAADASQETVWGEVDEVHAGIGLAPETRALREAYEDEDTLARIDRLIGAIVPPRGANGMVVVCHGRILGIDLFNNERMFKIYREKLLRAYALEALTQPRGRRNRRGIAWDPQGFLDVIWRESSLARRRTPGIGENHRITGRGFAGEMLREPGRDGAGGIVHLAAFPTTAVVIHFDGDMIRPAPGMAPRR